MYMCVCMYVYVYLDVNICTNNAYIYVYILFESYFLNYSMPWPCHQSSGVCEDPIP